MAGTKKAGPITLALGLIILGVILLLSNITGTGILTAVLKFWPILLIGLGAEYFVRSYINKKEYGSEADTRFSPATVVIILLMVMLGYTGQLAVGLLKNQDINTFISEAIAGDRYSYNKDFKSEAIDVKAGITSIKLDGLSGKIDLVPSIDGKFYAEAHMTGWGPTESEARRRAEMFKIDIRDGDVINIYQGQRLGTNFRRPLTVTYRFMIPKGINVWADGEGPISADNIEANLTIKSANEDVTLRNIKGDVSFEGENSQATFEGINGNLDLRSGSGKVFIKDAAKNIHADNDNSNIEIISTKPVSSNYTVNTLNGYIVLKIPETSDAAVKAETATGKIRGNFKFKYEPGQPHHPNQPSQPSQPTQPDQPTQPSQPGIAGYGGTATLVLGSEKGLINLTTETGNIVIDKY